MNNIQAHHHLHLLEEYNRQVHELQRNNKNVSPDLREKLSAQRVRVKEMVRNNQLANSKRVRTAIEHASLNLCLQFCIGGGA